MKFSFEVEGQKKHLVKFSWNQLWGSMKITVNERVIAKKHIQLISPMGKHPTDPVMNFAGLSIKLLEKWEFEIEEEPQIKVRIEKQRPKFFPAFRPHSYRAFVNEKIVTEISGF